MSFATHSFAASRRRNDGPRRVSFQESRLTSSRLYDSDEEEEERLRQEEEEEERALSERFGEAAESKEDGGGDGKKRKRSESEKDIAKELDQEEKKKTRKVRPQLVSLDLTGDNGLRRLPTELKRIKYKPKKGKKRDVLAAASYCKNLVLAYRNFCKDLMPSMNFEDVVLKIEQLGIKKDVKDHVQGMRDNVRNQHLEFLYGREKAEKMLQELNEGLKQSEVEYNMWDQPETREHEVHSEEIAESSSTGTNAASTTTSTVPENDSIEPKEDDDEEREATFDENPPIQNEMELAVALSPVTESQKTEEKNEQFDDDDVEEEEATFDDVVRVDVPLNKEKSDEEKADETSSVSETVDSALGAEEDVALSTELPKTCTTTDSIEDSAVQETDSEKSPADDCLVSNESSNHGLPLSENAEDTQAVECDASISSNQEEGKEKQASEETAPRDKVEGTETPCPK